MRNTETFVSLILEMILLLSANIVLRHSKQAINLYLQLEKKEGIALIKLIDTMSKTETLKTYFM